MDEKHKQRILTPTRPPDRMMGARVDGQFFFEKNFPAVYMQNDQRHGHHFEVCMLRSAPPPREARRFGSMAEHLTRHAGGAEI